MVLAEILKDAQVTDEQVQKELESLTEEAKEAAATDISYYESYPPFSMVYVPEGARMARHVRISLTDEDISYEPEDTDEDIIFELGDEEIFNDDDDTDIGTDTETETETETEYSDDTPDTSDDDDEEPALFEEPIEVTDEIAGEAENVAEALAAGNYDDLAQFYDTADEHIVLIGSETYDSAYIDALYAIDEVGGVSEPVVCSDGVYVIQYLGEAVIADDAAESVKEQIRQYLTEDAEEAAQVAAYEQWSSKYKYDIDYETVGIDPEDII